MTYNQNKRFNELEVNLESAKNRIKESRLLIAAITQNARPKEPEDDVTENIEELEFQQNELKAMFDKLESTIQTLNMIKSQMR